MRDRWYSDNRDLVKWGSLVELAEQSCAKTILQIAFYRREEQTWSLMRNHRSFRFSTAVLNHFRNLEGIAGLSSTKGIEISVFKEDWPGASRRQYMESVLQRLKDWGQTRLVVLLDPDTGIAPLRPTARHIAPEELRTVFNALKPKDWLACYQHARRQRNWVKAARHQFSCALSIPAYDVETFSCAELAPDVALLAAQRKQRRPS